MYFAPACILLPNFSIIFPLLFKVGRDQKLGHDSLGSRDNFRINKKILYCLNISYLYICATFIKKKQAFNTKNKSFCYLI